MVYNFAIKKVQDIPTGSATKKSNHCATHNMPCNDSATLKFANLIKIKNVSAGNEENYNEFFKLGLFHFVIPER